ncbi:hypothetical protein [Nocardia arthritidis]|uniref:Uncharacterized protein n=1 Tax=Nocardia arthritidis TaxID=228602 RepID=A0A6G9Y4Y7_9NOCA|nr:hypothetical protein [Nocardia arthritidis]QIS08214.1 hypothetical protein F5544_01455 [Nocardia arthritidis]
MNDFTFPTPYRVKHLEYKETLLPNGRPKPEWIDRGMKPVIGWNPPDSRPGGDKFAGPNRVVVELELLAPPDFGPVGHLDKIILPDGKERLVIGAPEDYGTGPFDFHPGMIINLRLTQG